MNTYYLKKLRKEAWKLFGIIWFEESPGNSVWNVGKRRDLVPCYLSIISPYYIEKDAIKALEEIRRNYITTKARDIRYTKKLRKYNKQLAKL